MTFLLYALAVYYWSHVIVETVGPFDVFKNFRDKYPLGGLTACIKCTAIWVGLIVFLINLVCPAFTEISAAACMSILFYHLQVYLIK